MTRLSTALRHAAAALMILGSVAAAAAAPPATDLDQLDRMKKTVALASGVTLAYVEFGEPKGPPVVLIHGFTDNARGWMPLVPYLGKNLRLVLVDLRAHGASSKPECCYTRFDFAYDVKLLLDRLGIARADIIGVSLGSIVTQTLAEYWPERMRRVVLISSTGQLPTLSFQGEVLKLRDPIDPDSPFMLEWYAAPTLDTAFVQRLRREAAAIPADIWRAVLDQGLSGVELRNSLPRLKAPALLIWGAKDQIFGPEDRRSLQEGLPGARVVLYPELGHDPFWEDPQAVATEINAFLRD